MCAGAFPIFLHFATYVSSKEFLFPTFGNICIERENWKGTSAHYPLFLTRTLCFFFQNARYNLLLTCTRTNERKKEVEIYTYLHIYKFNFKLTFSFTLDTYVEKCEVKSWTAPPPFIDSVVKETRRGALVEGPIYV